MKKTFFYFILSTILLFSEKNTKDSDLLTQKFFEKAFKKNARIQKVYMPLKINNILHDEVLVKIDNKGKLSINKETRVYILSLIKEESKKKFHYLIEKKDFLALNALNKFGIIAKYNKEDVFLEITIPPKLRKSSFINFNQDYIEDFNDSINPEKYSGGLNLYLNQSYRKNDKKFQRESLVGSSDIFLNIHNVVLKGHLQYQEENHQFNRDRFYLIKDDESNQLRYTIGDILLPNDYRMSYTESLGIKVEKSIAINRDFSKNVSRVNSYEFFLKNQSRVEVFINGRLTQTLDLEAGTQNLFNLGIASGLNKIKLKVIEPSGKTEFIEFNDFNYQEILKEGYLLYGVGIGLASHRNAKKLIYDKEDKLFSGYINYGLFNMVSLKSGLQISSNDFKSIEGELIIGTNFGMINPYYVYSKNKNKSGEKKGIDYRLNINNINLNLGYEEQNGAFRRLDNYKQLIDIESQLYRANIYTPIGYGINLGTSYSNYIKGKEKERNIGIKLYKTFSNQLEIRLDIDKIEKTNQIDKKQFYLTINYKFGKNQISYNQNIQENGNRLNIDRLRNGHYGISNHFNYEHTSNQDNYYGETNLRDEKFVIDGTYNLSKSSSTNEQLIFQLASGIVFSGDKVTITAPINSSFLIVENDEKLEDSLGIEGFQKSDEYVYDKFAIELSDYNNIKLHVDETKLDFGTDLINPENSFKTNYHSGSIMDIKVKNLCSAKGILINQNTGEPLSQKAFKIFNTHTGEKSMSFTNSKGSFIIEGIEVGHYNVSLIKEEKYEGIAKFTFDVTESIINKKLIDLGKIKIKVPKLKNIKKYKIYNNDNL